MAYRYVHTHADTCISMSSGTNYLRIHTHMYKRIPKLSDDIGEVETFTSAAVAA